MNPLTSNTTKNIVNVMYNNHRILIDKVYDAADDEEVPIVWVITPALKAMPFVVCIYENDADTFDLAKAWVDDGCPEQLWAASHRLEEE
jgi:hypothetical protein